MKPNIAISPQNPPNAKIEPTTEIKLYLAIRFIAFSDSFERVHVLSN